MVVFFLFFFFVKKSFVFPVIDFFSVFLETEKNMKIKGGTFVQNLIAFWKTIIGCVL